MATSPRPTHCCFSGRTQAGPRAPAWGPQLPPQPPPRLLPVPAPQRVSPPHLGLRQGSLPAATPCADAEGEGTAVRPGAGDPLCEYRSRPQPPGVSEFAEFTPDASVQLGEPSKQPSPSESSLGSLDPLSPRSSPPQTLEVPPTPATQRPEPNLSSPGFIPISTCGSF